MKKVIIMLFAVCVFFAPAVVFASSCGSTGLPDYYILFTIDGQEYVYAFGVSDIEAKAYAVYDGIEETRFYATDDKSASSTNEPDNYIIISFLGDGPVDYVYGINPMYISFYTVDGYYAIVAATLTVTQYGDVGGSIEGTFTATVEATFNGTETINLEDGKFRIIRIADGTPYPQWGIPTG